MKYNVIWNSQEWKEVPAKRSSNTNLITCLIRHELQLSSKIEKIVHQEYRHWFLTSYLTP